MKRRDWSKRCSRGARLCCTAAQRVCSAEDGWKGGPMGIRAAIRTVEQSCAGEENRGRARPAASRCRCPGCRLGGEKEMIEQAQLGALQLRAHFGGPMGRGGPAHVFNLLSSSATRDKCEGYRREIGAELLGDQRQSQHALVALSRIDAGTPQSLLQQRERRPADLKGMKIRTEGQSELVETMNAMAANASRDVFRPALLERFRPEWWTARRTIPPTCSRRLTTRKPGLQLTAPDPPGSWCIQEHGTRSRRGSGPAQEVAREAQTEERGLGDKMVRAPTQKLKGTPACVRRRPTRRRSTRTRTIRRKYGSKHVAS